MKKQPIDPEGAFLKKCLDAVDAALDRHIAEAEQKAETSHRRHKFMMYGYWKAIAVHLRRLKRELRKELAP